ncbi:hypothetical protein [Phaeobacter sp. JH20_27]|uniref:hypothetical protein n=1 Tax=Phaeobacter sp. JH20_27 TaxID=3112484 RepID=UPI003A88A731
MRDASVNWNRQRMAVLETTERKLEKALHPFFVSFSWFTVIYLLGFAWMNLGSKFPAEMAFLYALCVFATGLAALALFGLFFAVVVGCVALRAIRRLTEQSSVDTSKSEAFLSVAGAPGQRLFGIDTK